ncbi:MAG: TlpA disulfide reductase family protein [Spirochaetaceae bacterium]
MTVLALLITPSLIARGNGEQTTRPSLPAREGQTERETESDRETGAAEPTADEVRDTSEAGALSDDELVAVFSELGLRTPDAPVDAVDFELPVLSSDSPRSLSSFEGTVVLLNFWASWCPPCIEEMPSMQSLYEQLDGSGFEIVAVNLQEDPATVRSFMEENGYDFPVLLDDTGRVAREYGVRGIPTSYVVHSDGRLLAMHVGPHEWDDGGFVDAFETIAR